LGTDELQSNGLCDSILLIDGVSSCAIFDLEGRRVEFKVKNSISSDFLGKYGGVVGCAIVGGLKSVEPLAGKLSGVVATFEGLKTVAIAADSGFSVVVTTRISTDSEYVRRMVRAELMRRGVEAGWRIQS